MSADQQPDGAGAAPETEPGGDGPQEADHATMRTVILCVACSAAAMTVLALLSFGVRAALGVAIGGAIATANLYAFARIVDAFLSRRGHTASWGFIAIVKLVALVGGVWLVLRSDAVPSLSLAVGYSSLVVGITLGTLFAPKPPEDDAGAAPRRRG
jgi:hypothetical protein